MTFFTLFLPGVMLLPNIEVFCEYICTLIISCKCMGVFELIGWVVVAHTFAVMLTVFLCLHPEAWKDIIILHLVQSHFINPLPSLLPMSD